MKRMSSLCSLDGSISKTLDYFTDDVHYIDERNKKVAETRYNFMSTRYSINLK